MNTKQEKLAAARKKLKEFQGKQRENDVNRMKNTFSPADMNQKWSISSISTDTASSCRMEENNIDCRSPEICYPSVLESHIYKSEEDLSNNPVRDINSKNSSESAFPPNVSMSFTHNSQYPDPYLPSADTPSGEFIKKEITGDSYNKNLSVANAIPSNHANGFFTSEIGVPCPKIEKHSVRDNIECSKVKAEICTLFKDSEGYSAPEKRNSPPVMPQTFSMSNDPIEFFSNNFNNNQNESKKAQVNCDVQPSQSMSHLIEEKNNLMEVLKRTEELLKLKTDQEERMAENVSYLQSNIADLEGRFLMAQKEIQELRMINDKLMKQRDIDFKMLEDLERKLGSREEQFSELQQKFELKTKECESSSLKLKEYDSQLSSSLLKIQQLSLGDSKETSAKMTELQNEKTHLMGRIQDLEKRLEILDREKERSSQSFHTYAQLYNGQINSLSTEVRNFVKENQQLLEKNEVLKKNIRELRKEKEESNSAPDQTQIAHITNKLTELSRENELLRRDLKEKADEIEALEKEKIEKSEELIRVNATLKEIRSEYMKQQENSSSHQKLLATVESDKVAASRAVAQNCKLKEQVAELEEGFIKLSHEKLQLTDELSHEKHVRKELELRLQELGWNHCHEHDHHSKSDGTTNESADIGELKNIIRQLEEDKTELLARLNSGNSSSTKMLNNSVGKDEKKTLETRDVDANREDPESTKLLLQQMEEKVKKTMNDIAALDEEKEKLEHLVLQLQGETDTIGEYISLYQTQRMMLRQRNKEKDEQLMQLSKDKEELKSKLSTLNDLVNHLLTEKGIDNKKITNISPYVREDNKEVTEDTAMKIQTLINEIQSTNLIDNQSVAFEHCPCCSGRLITI